MLMNKFHTRSIYSLGASNCSKSISKYSLSKRFMNKPYKALNQDLKGPYQDLRGICQYNLSDITIRARCRPGSHQAVRRT